MFDINGKVALITGGASGIGLLYAKELLRNGVKAVTLADVNEEFGKKALNEINAEFGANRAIFVKTDVTNKNVFEDAFKTTIATFKNLDILINNAGILNDGIWEKEICININGTVHGVLLGLDALSKHRSGGEAVILNISSIVGLEPAASLPVYTATKTAVIGLSRAWGNQFHYDRTTVKVLTFCPGVTNTPLMDLRGEGHKTFGPEYQELVDTRLSRLPAQAPEDVARAVVAVIKNGGPGTVWVAEAGEPAYEIVFPPRQNLRKQ